MLLNVSAQLTIKIDLNFYMSLRFGNKVICGIIKFSLLVKSYKLRMNTKDNTPFLFTNKQMVLQTSVSENLEISWKLN